MDIKAVTKLMSDVRPRQPEQQRDAAAASPAGQEKPEPVEQRPVDNERLTKAVHDINDYVQTLQRDLYFSIDEGTGRTVVKVVDPETQETIRQIPSELALSLAEALSQGEELQNGMILRDQA